jgi:hypothetical protein
MVSGDEERNLLSQICLLTRLSFPLLDRAFAAKHLADLGQEEADFAVQHWDIHDWSTLDKRLTGPEFECGGHRW